MKQKPMEPVMIRLPPDVREKAREMAKRQTDDTGTEYNETDVYRTAIQVFLESNFTDSTVAESEVINP